MEKEIISLSGADNWWAGYGDEQQQNFHRVVVFALVRHEEGTSVKAMDVMDFENGNSFCDESHNFRGLFHLTDFEKPGEILSRGAFVRFVRGAH